MKKKLTAMMIVLAVLCTAACGKSDESENPQPTEDAGISEETAGSEDAQTQEEAVESTPLMTLSERLQNKVDELTNSDIEKIPQDKIVFTYKGNSLELHKYDTDMKAIAALFPETQEGPDGPDEALDLDVNKDGVVRFIHFTEREYETSSSGKALYNVTVESKYTSEERTDTCLYSFNISEYMYDNNFESASINGLDLSMTSEDALAVLGKPDEGSVLEHTMFLKWFYEIDGEELTLEAEFELDEDELDLITVEVLFYKNSTR